MTSRDRPSRKTSAKATRRGRSQARPFYRSPKLWAGIAVLGILVGALWAKTRRPDTETAGPQPAPGAPVPLSEAPALDEGPRRTEVPDSRLINVSDDPKRGSPSAPVRIVEFADFQCPSCAQFFENTAGALTSLYGDNIEWAFLDYPLTQHERAMPAAIAASCAHRQGKFWPYHDLVFRNQTKLSDSDLKKYADQAGLDVSKWETCYENQETRSEVEEDVQLGEDLGVDATPTFFVGGERLKGAMPVTSFMEIIDPLLKRAAQGTAAGGAQGEPAPNP